MKTNKQLTPKELTIYVYKTKTEEGQILEILGRYKNKTFGTSIEKTWEMGNTDEDGIRAWKLLKENAIKGVFYSLYALKEWGIDPSKQTMTAKVLGERSFPKENPYKVISVNV